MKQIDFPSIYQSADELSLASQGLFFRFLFCNLFFLVVAAGISIANSSEILCAVVQVIVLLFALGSSIYLYAVRPDRDWYSARAIAESVKTLTWRYISKAEPFVLNEAVDRERFLLGLKQVVDQNKDIAKKLIGIKSLPQITKEMSRLRDQSISDRLGFYVEQRVVDQLNWYTKKADDNNRLASKYFWLLIGVNVLAIVFAIGKVLFLKVSYWPTDLFIAMAAGVLGWIQAKRYTENSASYALAAHEISLIKEQSVSVKTAQELSLYVGDAENAFSREHTQWVARKDY